MIFDYSRSFSSPAQTLTAESFNELINAPWLVELCAKIQQAANTKEYSKLKRGLPCVMWQAHFADGKRHDQSAIHSGLYMLDIDHIEPVRMEELRNKALSLGLDNLGIYIIHKTPSEHGLRFVAKMLAKNAENVDATIAAHQKWLSDQLGVTEEEFDSACKDWARASFLPCMHYFYFINPAIFTDEAEVVLNKEVNEETTELGAHPAGSGESPVTSGEARDIKEEEVRADYRGIKITDIARAYFDRTGGMPVEGERHQRFLDAARVLRYICDFKAKTLIAALSPLYEDLEDLTHVCEDACKKMKQGCRKPEILEEILREMSNGSEKPNSEGENTSALPSPSLPKVMPPIFRDYVKIAPEDFKQSSYIALLPVLGTVFSHLRSEYLDGKIKTPSFMAVIEAPQASGKSFLEQIDEQMLLHVHNEDEVSWGLWQKYMQDRKRNKNKEEQPEEPDAPIRCIPATISITQYLVRQKHCPERHLYSFIPEIATLTRTNSAGAWSQKSELYRLAFDNAKFGQDYASDNSFSGVVRVFYNWLASGTPLDVKKFFKNCEDGLVSRVLFCTLPDQLGAKMPKWGRFSAKELSELQKLVKVTGTERQLFYELSYVNEALEKWLEEKRQLVVSTGDRALDVFRRRSAQIGFEAAMIFHHLYLAASTAKVPKITKPQQKTIIANAIYVAEVALAGQYGKFGEELNEIDAEQYSKAANAQGYARSVLDALPKVFYRQDVEAELRLQQRKTRVRMLLYVWIKNKLIKKIGDGQYEKL